MKNNEITRRWQAHPSWPMYWRSRAVSGLAIWTHAGRPAISGASPWPRRHDLRRRLAQRRPQIDLRDADFSMAAGRGFDIRDARVQRCTFDSVGSWATYAFMAFPLKTAYSGLLLQERAHHHRIPAEHAVRGPARQDTLSFHARRIEDCLFEEQDEKIDFKSSPIRNTRFSGELLECVFFGHPSIDVVDADAEIYRSGARRGRQPDGRGGLLGRQPDQLPHRQLLLSGQGHPHPGQNCISRLNPDFFDTASALLRQDMPRRWPANPDVAGDLLQAGRQAAP